MKKYFKFLPVLFFAICLLLSSCTSEQEESLTTFEKSNSELIYDRTNESNPSSNLPLLPDISTVRTIDKNSNIGLHLINFVNLVGNYDIDSSNIELVNMTTNSGVNLYSIPFNGFENKRLLVQQEDDRAKILIATSENLPNNNKLYRIDNYLNELLFQVEHNEQNQLGNHIISNNNNGFFLYDFQSETQANFVNKTDTCLGHNNFNDCMQCAWEECSSSWICGAVLAVRPIEAIGFAVGLCGLNTIANLK